MRHKIFVPLLSDSQAMREVDAEPAGEGRFRIVGAAPDGERLQFKRREIVECEIATLPNGKKGLVAMRSVSADPEYRQRRTIYAVTGALVGAVFGAGFALWFDLSLKAAGTGAVLGAIAFAYASVRWGDTAWEKLGGWSNFPWL